MQRFGSVVQVKPGRAEEYKRLHAAIWPGVARMIAAANIRNYSIYLRRLPDGQEYLFSYFEYVGVDVAADMARVAADPETLRWWDVCKPCLIPLPDRGPDEYWAGMEEVFHQE